MPKNITDIGCLLPRTAYAVIFVSEFHGDILLFLTGQEEIDTAC